MESLRPPPVYTLPTMYLTLLIAFSVLFVVTHMAMSHGAIRERLVGILHGEWPFRGVYSLVSVLTLGGAVVVFWDHRGLGPVLWELSPVVARVIAFPLMLLALPLLFLSLAQPSPAAMVPGKVEARGVLRITRHPMNMAFALFGAAHLIATGVLGDVVFFGQFLVLGVLGAYHQDARKRRAKGEVYREFARQTSVLPFAAVIRGRNRLEPGELAFPMLALGVVAYILLAVFHGRLFGVPLF